MKKRLLRSSQGFSLVEVALALGIASFCLVALLALLPVGESNNKESVDQTIAAGIASEVAADLRVNATPSATTPRFNFNLPAVGGSSTMIASPQTIYLAENGVPTGKMGQPAVSTGSTPSIYRVTVGFKPPSAGKEATLTRILVTWPALADPVPTVWPAKFAGSFEDIVAINCN